MKTLEEKAQLIQTLRTKAIQQTEEQAAKQRFGLFSQPPPLSIGDTSYDKFQKSYRDETGKVKIAPRNFLTSAPKSGKISSSYFSNCGYVTIGSKYVDPDRQQRLYELEKKRKMPQDRAVFKPADFEKTIINVPYEHLTDLKPKIKINYKGEDGRVIIGKKNILAGPTNELHKPYEHAKDEYSRKDELERKFRKEHEEKMKEKNPFKTWDVGNKNFVTDKRTFGLDQQLENKKLKKPSDPHFYPHEKEFRPSNPPKNGYNATINKFPEYIGDPLRQVVRKHVEKTKDAFKLNHPGDFTRPTPSVSCNKINLRKIIASHF